MKNPSSPLSDVEFDRALRAQRNPLAVPDSFQLEVWRRIETAEDVVRAGGFMRRLDGFLSALLRPAFATATVLLTASGGLWLGAQAERPVPQGKNEYVRTISPFSHEAGGRHE